MHVNTDLILLGCARMCLNKLLIIMLIVAVMFLLVLSISQKHLTV